ncbi:hypothetical protein K438DRAFT_2024114 [Mycena galopus ATCC 62051]|nr:hypothetical protein K438DRAFT_2024114 [Mycena galopus ATCC 62051]
MSTAAQNPAPALAIPYELIFLLCLPRDGIISPSPKTAPFLLSQICSHWRSTALSVPHLWNSIFLDFEHGPDERYDGISALFGAETYPLRGSVVALADSWFTRAAGLPLSSTIRCLDPTVLFPHNLIGLIVSNDSSLGSHGRRSTSLTALEFWPHFSGRAEDCLRLFHRFPHLCHLQIGAIHGSIAGYSHTLPSLTTLILRNDLKFLNNVQTPALQHLDVRLHDRVSVAHIACLVSRSACALTHLTLFLPDIQPDSLLLECFTSTPALVDLKISACTYHRFSILRSRDTLPHLQRLHFMTDEGNAVYPAFLDLLRARRSLLRAELVLVASNYPSKPPADIYLVGFTALTEDGMRIKLRSLNFQWPHDFENDTEDLHIFTKRHPSFYVFAPFDPPLHPLPPWLQVRAVQNPETSSN